MKRLLATILGVVGPLACSSSGGGSAGTLGADGGAGRDAASTQDAPGTADASDPVDGADDAPVAVACINDSGAATPGDFANAPTCSPGTCTLAGTLGGAPIAGTYALSAFSFSNGTEFDASFGTAGHVDLMMEGATVVVGQTTTVLGTLVTPSDGPAPGTHVCLGDGTRLQMLVDDAGQTVRFVGHCMATSCETPTTAVAGDLAGCCAR